MSIQPRTSRLAAIDMQPDQFRQLGHQMIDRLADFLAGIEQERVVPDASVRSLRALLKSDQPLPENGLSAESVITESIDLLTHNSTLNGHPLFMGYISGAPAPIGALGDLLAAVVNPNVGGWMLSPMATEIELQTVRWIAELVGYPADSAGVMVSGGNVANFVGFVAARHAKAPWDVRAAGMAAGDGRSLRVYVSKETHTWIEKAADMYGIGTEAICWLPTDEQHRMDLAALRAAIESDLEAGHVPFMVVGAAGSTAVGAVDKLAEIAAICKEYDLWFHVDGAYGAAAAVLDEASEDLRGLALADSVAIDPHKWLYAPLEAACTLVRDRNALVNAFSYTPSYYHFEEHADEAPTNFYEYGPQNSRGFRALKVWMALKQVGRKGYQQMIAEDIRLAKLFYDLAAAQPELEAATHSLSVTTWRFVPRGLDVSHPEAQAYLDRLNTEILTQVQNGGEAFISNAVIDGHYYLRLCVVNFRTSDEHMHRLLEITLRAGHEQDAKLRPASLK